MRQRITFIHKPEDALPPTSIAVASASLALPSLKAAREDRITFGLDELPDEVRLVLEQAHELHIRYAASRLYSTVSPFNSRLSPGLHVYYSPRRNVESSSDRLCPLIQNAFALADKSRCQNPETSFSSLPSQRFQHSTDYEYYQPSSQASQVALVEYMKGLCPPRSEFSCGKRIETLKDAGSIDFDYDTISHALTVSAYWEPQEWNVDIHKLDSRDRVEVGILSSEKPTDPEELSLGGFLTVLGDDTKPSATLFSFPARHHQHAASYSAQFLTPTGLHPNLQLKISNSIPPKDHETCTLHAQFTFPRVIFADKYQLSDPLFMASKNLTAIRYITTPVDLEAPEYVMDIWGSSMLLELAPPSPTSNSSDSGWWTAEIPLHLRYLPPSPTGYSDTDIPWPVLFWACTADEGTKFTTNPFERANLGYDGLFGPRTMFYHLTPAPEPFAKSDADGVGLRPQDLYNVVTVPVLDDRYTEWIELGTAVSVAVGFVWVLWKLGGVWWREGYGSFSRYEKAAQAAQAAKGKEGKKTQ